MGTLRSAIMERAETASHDSLVSALRVALDQIAELARVGDAQARALMAISVEVA